MNNPHWIYETKYRSERNFFYKWEDVLASLQIALSRNPKLKRDFVNEPTIGNRYGFIRLNNSEVIECWMHSIHNSPTHL